MPASAAPSAYSTFIPNFDASGRLTQDFTRNPASFRVNQWTETRPVLQMKGYYARILPDFATRSVAPAGSRNVWKPGADRPSGANNQVTFTYPQYITQRYDYPSEVPVEAIDQTELLLEAIIERGLLAQCMTERTELALAALTSTSIPGSNTASLHTLEGGSNNMITGTTTNPYFRDALLQGLSALKKSTGGSVEPKDCLFLMNPDLARKIAISAEVNQLFIQSKYALDYAIGESNVNFDWGLPPSYAGIRLVVEDTIVNTSPMGTNSPVMGYAFDSHTGWLLVRPGLKPVLKGVMGGDGAPLKDDDMPPVVSTVVGFFYEENTVESRSEPWHRRFESHVATNYQFQVTATQAIFKYTNCDN
jgi:hypothetical protein